MLPQTYVIVICGFDCFGYGKYCHNFQNRCKEDLQLILENGTKEDVNRLLGATKEEIEKAQEFFE